MTQQNIDEALGLSKQTIEIEEIVDLVVEGTFEEVEVPAIVTNNSVIIAPKNDKPPVPYKPDPEVVKIKDNYEELYDKGNNALDDLLEIAKSSQSGRAYEVAAGMIKVLLDANKAIHDVHRDQKDDEELSTKPEETTVNNNLFVGSTAELQQMLKEVMKK